MKIFLTTHATTTDHEKGIASGWNDCRLSRRGIEQATELGNRFNGIVIDLICCSDLTRATETAGIAFEDKYPLIIDERLREINYGDFNGKPADIIQAMRKMRISEPFSNGESYEKAVARVHGFFRELTKNHAEKVILTVGHSVVQIGLETLASGKNLEDCLNTPFVWQPYWEYSL